MNLSKSIRLLIPKPLKSRIIAILHRLDRDPTRVFSRVYSEGAWGQATDGFYSGDGSHDPEIVEPYVAAVRAHLSTLQVPLCLVDIGCGDFNVGHRLVDAVDRYIACDVVPELIARNRMQFQRPNLQFVTLDAVRGALPDGNVVTIRQVLQHLSNVQIALLLPKLAQFREWIVTEHLPASEGFEPNKDKRQGRTMRPDFGSGVVLTAPPFNIKPRTQEVLCQFKQYGGLVRTIAYSFDSP